MKDEELFELCKEVYKRTGERWDGTDKCYAYLENPYVKGVWSWEIIPLHEDSVDDVDEWHPLYTSDYLLEKIDEKIGEQKIVHVFSMFDIDTYEKYFRANVGTPGSIEIDTERTDTPRKALLKLVIALDDVGVKL